MGGKFGSADGLAIVEVRFAGAVLVPVGLMSDVACSEIGGKSDAFTLGFADFGLISTFPLYSFAFLKTCLIATFLSFL